MAQLTKENVDGGYDHETKRIRYNEIDGGVHYVRLAISRNNYAAEGRYKIYFRQTEVASDGNRIVHRYSGMESFMSWHAARARYSELRRAMKILFPERYF